MIAADNNQGAIEGKLPGQKGYLKAALKKSTVVLSTLQAGEFDTLNPYRILNVKGNQYLQFAAIKGGSLGDLQRGGSGELVFANATVNGNPTSAVQANALNTQTVDLDFRLPNGKRFQDLMLQLTKGNVARALGSNMQGTTPEREIIDLTGQTTPMVNATIEVFREAKFNDTVGLYAIEDEQGSVKDPVTGNMIRPGDTGYLKAALANRVDLNLSGKNGQTMAYSAAIATGKLLSTFLVVDGDIEALLDQGTANAPTVYFNHIGANSDGMDHVRLLGDNMFGYEDKAGGGDMDFDDVIVKMSFA